MTIEDIKHCLKVMVDCEVCEECNLYGTTGTDHCEHDCVYGALDIIDKYQQLEDFARWVATEVIDEEMWTYNHLAFAELACRKLVQLGIMQESDGEYTYEVVEDGNVD